MCGIAGITTWDRTDNRAEVNRMVDLFNHRGPDDCGVKQLEGICLGHKRLSIIDLSMDGHQPMSDVDKRYWIVFNGEVYGFSELRAKLIEEGVSFKSKSDTEVIIEGFKKWGLKLLCEKLNGMFAFALWDNIEHKLMLARDRFGEKPLYFRIFENGNISFASYSKSLIGSNEELKLNPDGVVSFLNQGFCSSNTPIYKEINAVNPATFMVFDGIAVKTECYYEPTFKKKDFNCESWKKDLNLLIRDVVKEELVSDVGCSALLSGGVDSSLLAKYVSEINPEINFFTVKMNDSHLDESPIAKEFANHLKLNHTIIDANQISINEFNSVNKQLSEPLGDSSIIAMYIVSKAVSEHAKVLITGDGGDELFAGYNTISLAYRLQAYRKIFSKSPFRQTASIVERIFPNHPRKPLIRKAKTFIGAISKDIQSFRMSQSLIPSSLETTLYGDQIKESHSAKAYKRHLNALWDKYDVENDFENLMILDLKNTLPGDYIPKVDVSTMSNSIEARSPLLHHAIADYAFTMPMSYKRFGGQAKGALKELLKMKVGKEAVGKIIKGKRGFVIPVDKWLDNEWNVLIQELKSSSLVRDGFINKKGIEKINKGYIYAPEVYSRIRYNLVALNSWLKK